MDGMVNAGLPRFHQVVADAGFAGTGLADTGLAGGESPAVLRRQFSSDSGNSSATSTRFWPLGFARYNAGSGEASGTSISVPARPPASPTLTVGSTRPRS